jgi:hypothetical protein
MVYQDAGNSGKGTAVVGTISGTSISFGSPVVFNNASTDWETIAFDPSNAGKCLISYQDAGNSGYGTAIMGQISDTTMIFGSEFVYSSGSTQYATVKGGADPLTADRYLIAYRDDADSDKGRVIVANVSGTDISYGWNLRYDTSFTAQHNQTISFDPTNPGKFILGYNGNTPQAAYVIVGTISSTNTLSFGSPDTVETADEQSYMAVSFDPNTSGQFIYCWRSGDPNRYGTARLGQMATTTTNLTFPAGGNYIGTSTAAYSDTETATIMLKGGISTNQSSLTIGSDYYIQNNGSLSTTADYPSVKLGKAISATAVLLSGE